MVEFIPATTNIPAKIKIVSRLTNSEVKKEDYKKIDNTDRLDMRGKYSTKIEMSLNDFTNPKEVLIAFSSLCFFSLFACISFL